MAVTIHDLWNRLENSLKTNAPLAFASLRPPAKDQEIRRAEERLGVKFPDDLKDSLKIHDGNRAETRTPPHSICFIPNEYDDRGIYQAGFGDLLPVNSIVEQTERFRGYIAEWARSKNDAFCEYSGPVHRNGKWNWVIFVEGGGGDVLGLDLEPAEGGQVGQAVSIIHDPACLLVNAPSYFEWSKTLVERFESGRYYFAEYEGEMEATDRFDPGAASQINDDGRPGILRFPKG